LGYDVNVIDHLESGRSYLSKGFLKQAKGIADKNIHTLSRKISAQTPLIGIEPSAILSFRDEYPRLATNKTAANAIANCTLLFEEFFASELKMGNISASQFHKEYKTIKIHNHCHQKALSNQKVTFDMLNLPVNYSVTIINSGCCGMAGSFGYEKEHFEISMTIGEQKLFPAIRKTSDNVLLAANGSSCRHQIKDGTKRDAMHPAVILLNALNP
jgi:Fe-S oxidoreductase